MAGNRSTCTHLHCETHKPSYYFFTVELPADVFYNYTHSRNYSYLYASDYILIRDQTVTDRTNVTFSLMSDTTNYIIAAAQPNVAPGPRTTHLVVTPGGYRPQCHEKGRLMVAVPVVLIVVVILISLSFMYISNRWFADCVNRFFTFKGLTNLCRSGCMKCCRRGYSLLTYHGSSEQIQIPQEECQDNNS